MDGNDLIGLIISIIISALVAIVTTLLVAG